MKRCKSVMVVIICMVVVLVAGGCTPTETGGYEALKGVRTVKAFFDMRDTNPKIAAVHMKLILDSYKQLSEMNKKPVFVINFIAGAVKLISSDRDAFSDEDGAYLDQIAATAAEMRKVGIGLEVCMAAVNILGVDPASLNPDFTQVPNGWIAEIGYQAQGYSLVPVF